MHRTGSLRPAPCRQVAVTSTARTAVCRDRRGVNSGSQTQEWGYLPAHHFPLVCNFLGETVFFGMRGGERSYVMDRWSFFYVLIPQMSSSMHLTQPAFRGGVGGLRARSPRDSELPPVTFRGPAGQEQRCMDQVGLDPRGRSGRRPQRPQGAAVTRRARLPEGDSGPDPGLWRALPTPCSRKKGRLGWHVSVGGGGLQPRPATYSPGPSPSCRPF